MRAVVDILLDLVARVQAGHDTPTFGELSEFAQRIEATRFLPGVGVIVLNQGRVLLSQRLAGAAHGEGWWSCPGGGLEGTDDDIVAGALRELLEETKLVPVMTGVHAPRVVMHIEEGKVRRTGQPYMTAFVICHVEDTSTLSNPEPHKHSDWRWFHLDELPSKMWSRALVQDALLGVA